MENPREAHPRTRGRIRVRYGLEDLDRTAFTMNVSETGAFIRTNNVYPPGRMLKVEFNLGDKTVELQARIVWAKKVPPQLAHLLPCGMGIRFVNPPVGWMTLYESWSDGKMTR